MLILEITFTCQLFHMKSLILIVSCLSINCSVSAQATIQERLGYSKDTKLVIIHADDLGVAHSENEATIHALEKGSVSSASIMVPTPWFPEIAAYAASHPKLDFGLHLTLTSEWKYYKWGPLSGRMGAPGLVNKAGFFYESADSVNKNSNVAEVEKEIRMQIDKALLFGIDVTHLDSHMGVLFFNPEYLRMLIRVGHDYKVPVMLPGTSPRFVLGQDLSKELTDKDVLVDAVYTAGPQDFKTGMAAFYTKSLDVVKPGLSILVIHVAYDDKEMQAITVDHPDWGAAWRQADYDFFSSDKAKKLLAEKNIKVITWREVRDKIVRKM
jgi:chitin disaccharide deacetylase